MIDYLSFLIFEFTKLKVQMKTLIYTLLISSLLLVSQNTQGQMADSIKNHIDSSLLVLKKHSLYGNQIKWDDIEQKVYDRAKSAKSKSETFEALKIAFNTLGDKHAAYYQYNDEYRLPNDELMARYSDSIKAAWAKGPRIHSQMIEEFAYISIPYMGAGKQEDINTYANWIYDAVIALNKENPKGWILDLRLNGGGNIRPMLAGLAMFFPDGIVSYYIDRDGNAMDEAAFIDGYFTIDGEKQAAINNKIPMLKPIKVAVLIGPGTASSGEGVAVVFSQHEQAKLFGENSAGLANSTNGFVFNNDESYYLISTAYIGDKNKKILPESVKPDVVVDSNDAFFYLTEDTVVQAAITWLK